MTDDKRLIEDYLPIEAISAEASREKSVRKGHISTLHLWWARRPLVACRAAVYGALVPANQFEPKNGPEEKRKSLGRANAAKFVERLCKYPGDPRVIAEAQRHILDAHADRLTAELEKWYRLPACDKGRQDACPTWVDEFKWPKEKKVVTREDIEAGRAPRPRVLDPFAGGGAIPLEALRLGCEAYANDLNPVAHVIELCTLVYPQKYGKPDPNARGMTGPKNAKDETTWGGLAEEVRYWGQWVLEKVRAEIGDLYPPVPDPEASPEEIGADPQSVLEFAKDAQGRLSVPRGYLTPVAYLWTRTVKCKNPACGATVPLAGQTWLRKKAGRYVAMRMVPNKRTKRVRFEVVEAESEEGLGFAPSGFSSSGNATCPFCGTVANSSYVKAEGCASRMGQQLMAVVCTRLGHRGKRYVSADALRTPPVPSDSEIEKRILTLCQHAGLVVPDEPIITDAKNSCWTHLYGLTTFGSLFTSRQLLCLLTFSAVIRQMSGQIPSNRESDVPRVIQTYMALLVDRIADYNSTGCLWESGGEFIKGTFSQKGLPLMWDFVELGPFGGASGSPDGAIDWITSVIAAESFAAPSPRINRGSALNVPFESGSLDAVITDPPYYDNVPYANIADFFYVWLKRCLGDLYPSDFASIGTPKKQEAVADAKRHGDDRTKAETAYEEMMEEAFREASRVLKPAGLLTVVYAHKTTVGWATLVESLRRSDFMVDEAWPLDTERPGRVRAISSAALASSIFLVARKREGATTGSFDEEVYPELERIVRERVGTLWDMDIGGADLVISCVGAGLRAFTRHARVEYANGEEVPAERFLAEVETVVLETILSRLSKEVGGNGNRHTSLAGVDPATRFYILWRYTYRWAELDAGEAIVFANGTHVELDGQGSLSQGARALIEKKKSKYRLRDFLERGDEEKLGLPDDDGTPAPMIDALHRTLWLMEKRPRELPEFLRESRVNREQMRLVAQALAGPALKGGELGDVSPTAELAALAKLTANWRSVIEDADLAPSQRAARRAGQDLMDFE
jgi:putative DNA methylase